MSSRGVGARFLTLGGGEAVARLCAFAATVYLARTLSPALYGIVGVAMGVMLYLSQIADGGIELVGVPLVARAGAELASLAQPVLAVRFVLSLSTALVVMVVGLSVLPQPDGAILASLAPSLLFAGLSVRWIHIGLERAGGVAIARTMGEVVALVAILVLVHETGDVVRVPLALFLGAAVTAFILLVTLRRAGLPLVWDWAPRRATPVFQKSRHLVVFTLLGLLLFNFDLIYLRVRTGAEAAGYYAVAYTMISFAANLIVAFAHTVLPTLTRLDDDPRRRRELYATASAQAFAVALPVGVGAWYVSGQVISQVFGQAYLPGVVALQWLAFSVPLAALRELPIVALIASGRENLLIRVNAITAACNVALVVLMVPRYGLAGAAAATVATEVVRLAFASYYARGAGYQFVPVHRLVKAALASSAMALVLVTLAPEALWISAPLGAAVYGICLVALKGIRLDRRLPGLSV